ncbi:MAG: ribosome maturation factor RimM [Anaerolineaceae bacterium]
MAQSPSNKKGINDGSPKKGEPLFLTIGKIRKPHGVRGELSVAVLTEFPERIKPGKIVFVGERKIEQQIETIRFQNDGLLIKFNGINDRDEAGLFRNELIYIQAANLPKLEENEYYYHDLLNMQVKTEEGELLGSVSEILETGANEVLVVTQEEKEYLFPFIKQVVLVVDKEENVILIKKQEWK